ncbi:MAG: polysaccharide deacetylase family protein [Oscillospiraceae bacterium]|nr:polysaccharide deacetylase family protein [Oscillospiraceae bacterium]
MKNKKITKIISDIAGIALIAAFIFALIALLASVVSAHENNNNLIENKSYGWYSVPSKNGERPTFDINLDELKNYGAYAIGDANANGNDSGKVIYLTFDFGYENGNVKKCLDALNRHGVKGAFFILENVVKTNPELMKEIVETGHTAANHTLKHKNMCNIKDFAQYKKELEGLEKLFEETTGYKLSEYYRPPKGEFTKQNLEYNHKLGYKTIFWSLAYMDWDEKKQPDPGESIKKIIDRTHDGAVVLLHPTSATNAAIMDALIKEWKGMGYRFGTLDELTGRGK